MQRHLYLAPCANERITAELLDALSANLEVARFDPARTAICHSAMNWMGCSSNCGQIRVNNACTASRPGACTFSMADRSSDTGRGAAKLPRNSLYTNSRMSPGQEQRHALRQHRPVPMTPPIGAQPEVEAPVLRPTPGRFLWYCYGGRLPVQNHSWVLHDVTCRTWVLRHFARWMMVIIPVFFVFLAVMPGTFGTRFYIDVAVGGAILMFAFVNILIDTDRRAVRAGYGFSRPGEIRSARGVDRQRLSNHDRRERIAARQARRRG
jgi:hypothetical protein